MSSQIHRLMRPASFSAMTNVAALAIVLIAGAGCPFQNSYDAGFLAGFNRDRDYWNGYWDGYDTIDIEPIFYRGNEIPLINDDSFNAGFADGRWYAYNDGYFTDYRFAFVIGFSEGYDNAFWEDFLEFLANDRHIEFFNGGWSDGYHDGFSEGAIFGAFDFRTGLPFDWLDALLAYEFNTDVEIPELNLSTGDLDRVPLYEYGTDPFTLTKSGVSIREHPFRDSAPAIRRSAEDKAIDPSELSSLRPLTAEARAELDVLFDTSLRSDRELLLTSTYLERIQDYIFAEPPVAKKYTRASQ